MCPYIASEGFQEPLSTGAHGHRSSDFKVRTSASRRPAHLVGTRQKPSKTPALSAGLVLDRSRDLSARMHDVHGLGLRSTQRYALLLVGIDLAVGISVTGFGLFGFSTYALTDSGSLILWLLVWFASLSATGSFSPLAGFSSRRQIATSLKLSCRSGTTALAACSLITLILGHVPRPGSCIGLILPLTIASGLSRVLVTRVSPPRIIVVTDEHSSLPCPYETGPHIRHLRVSAAQIADPCLLIAEITENARRFDACAVEIVGDVGLAGPGWRSLSWGLREQHASLRFPLDSGPLRQHRVHCAVRGGRAVVEICAPAPPLGARLAKRSMDIVGASSLLVVFFPLLLILAYAVKVTSTGPALYKQERVGYNGKPFNILKFRTMAHGSDAQLLALLKSQDKGDTPLFKVTDDPRITPLGAILRRYSLDELPQLLNVLQGSMSLVGPRPQRPAEVALYRGDAKHRLGVRPGMTGLWQVSGRSRLSWEEAQQLDIDYAHNLSFWEDIRILVRTAKAVIGGEGAV